jgi:Na+/H+ antiporter NhaD/arsenite permease-like protein
VPALFALVVVFAVVWLQWHRQMRRPEAAPDTVAAAAVTEHVLDRAQTIKGVVAIVALLILFATPLPRETGALVIAALLLANRKITSRTMIAAVDWPLLLLVSCLFAITGGLNDSGVAAQISEFMHDHGLLPNSLLVLFPFAAVTSNVIGSVPTAMLLLQLWPNAPSGALYALASLSTLAGSFLLSGSLTNLLIAERAERMGAGLTFRVYARAGIPIAVLSLGFAILWLSQTHILPVHPPSGPLPP